MGNIFGIIMSVLAGALMSIQGVFNTRVSEKIGIWETGIIVHGLSLITTLIILIFAGNGDFKKLSEVNKLYLLGGVIGALITFTVIRGISSLGATVAISLILLSQLVTAASIDKFALFGCCKMTFGPSKIFGVIFMIIGIILFKLRG